MRSKPEFSPLPAAVGPGRLKSPSNGGGMSHLQKYLRAAREKAQVRRRLARVWILSQVRRVKANDALKLIESRGLKTINESWHFSWDLERFFDHLFLYENDNHSYIFHTEPINEWAPAPLFTNDSRVHSLIAKTGKACPFWLLKLSTFEDFLARRSQVAESTIGAFSHTTNLSALCAQTGL